MNANDLKIGENDSAFVITAVGRANFEYAVPIRELVNSNEGKKSIRLDLKECTAMDSTFTWPSYCSAAMSCSTKPPFPCG